MAARLRGLRSFQGRYRTLHLTWFAFFCTFVVWFNFAPFANTIAEEFGLTASELVTLGLCNVALTVPARVFVGMALDRWGPRRLFSAILVYSALPCTVFALSTSFGMLVVSRLALSIVGAGFVVGIRMVSEWFPPRELGAAEGVYGGWGNFGSAAAAFSLPVLAGLVAGDDGWRWAIGLTGLMAAAYGLYYHRAVTDTPDGVEYVRARRPGALEVTDRRAVIGLAALTVPLNLAVVLIAWRVWREGLIDAVGLGAAVAVAVALAAYQLRRVVTVNRPALRQEYPASDRYPFRTVAVLCLAYFCTFGSELAVVTMLPAFFADTWALGPALAGLAASGFAFMNLLARPAGGLMSDLLGSRRRTLAVLLVGLALGYAALSTLGPAWPVPAAIAVTMVCSFFVQSGEGAVFAIVPLVKKRVSGQIAGLAGAYGNLGALAFLTTRLFVSDRVFFGVIAVASVLAVVATRWLVEPADSFAVDLVTEEADPTGEREPALAV